MSKLWLSKTKLLCFLPCFTAFSFHHVTQSCKWYATTCCSSSRSWSFSCASFKDADRSNGGNFMNSIKGLAVILIAAGVLALAIGGFSYTKETHEAHHGSLDFSVKDKQRVNLPVWAGVGAIVIGAGLLLTPIRKS